MMASIKAMCLFLLDPWLFMFQSLTYLPSTILRLIVAGNYSALVSPSQLQSAWFSSFWSVAGPNVRDTAESRVVALFEGRVTNGKIFTGSSEVGSSQSLRGMVLEIGPGTGMWVSLFADTHFPISKIYGVEPNRDVHHELRRRVVAAGLSDRYEIVPHGIEKLATSGTIVPGSLDCIVSVLCLCSIPEPEKNIGELFQYLKPGGTWFVYEHVRCESKMLRKSGIFLKGYQGILFCVPLASLQLEPSHRRHRVLVIPRWLVADLQYVTLQQPLSISSGHTSSVGASSAETPPKLSQEPAPGRK